jgi:hypothetical protein
MILSSCLIVPLIFSNKNQLYSKLLHQLRFLATSMANLSTFFVSLILLDILVKLQPNTYSWVITSIAANKVLKLFVSFSHLKLSTLNNFISCEEITRVVLLIEPMVFMTSAKENMIYRFGNCSLFVLIGCRFQVLYRIR